MRSCDGCTACCKVMKVRELDKPMNTWCPHCKIGVGCGIYDTRPKSCQGFRCVWLQTQSGDKPLALELRPDKSRIVMSTTNGGLDIVLNVSPDRPDAWKHGGIAKLVAEMLADDITVLLKCGDTLRKL
jgi:hypothetical protein